MQLMQYTTDYAEVTFFFAVNHGSGRKRAAFEQLLE